MIHCSEVEKTYRLTWEDPILSHLASFHGKIDQGVEVSTKRHEEIAKTRIARAFRLAETETHAERTSVSLEKIVRQERSLAFYRWAHQANTPCKGGHPS